MPSARSGVPQGSCSPERQRGRGAGRFLRARTPGFPGPPARARAGGPGKPGVRALKNLPAPLPLCLSGLHEPWGTPLRAEGTVADNRTSYATPYDTTGDTGDNAYLIFPYYLSLPGIQLVPANGTLDIAAASTDKAVSYTHLTLPTILHV